MSFAKMLHVVAAALLLAVSVHSSTLPVVAWSSGSALSQPAGLIVSANAVSSALAHATSQAGIIVLVVSQVQSQDLWLVKSAQAAVAGAQSVLQAPFVSGLGSPVAQLLPQAMTTTLDELPTVLAHADAASSASFVVFVDSACPHRVSDVVAAVVAALVPAKGPTSVVLSGASAVLVADPQVMSMQRRASGLIAPAPSASTPTAAPNHRRVKHYQYFTTPIAMGLFTGFLILFFIMIGNYGLMTTETSERMPSPLDKFLSIPNN